MATGLSAIVLLSAATSWLDRAASAAAARASERAFIGETPGGWKQKYVARKIRTHLPKFALEERRVTAARRKIFEGTVTAARRAPNIQASGSTKLARLRCRRRARSNTLDAATRPAELAHHLENAEHLLGDAPHVEIGVRFLHAGVVDTEGRRLQLGQRRLREQPRDRLQDKAMGDEAGLEFTDTVQGFVHGRFRQQAAAWLAPKRGASAGRHGRPTEDIA